jgi:thiamine-monophosphate kinase
MREQALIDWISSRAGALLPPEWVGPGDDCAVVTLGEERLLITTDQVLDGVHLDLAKAGPAAAGRKALARNLSDIAAMAAVPLCATATVSLPGDFADADARAVYTGMEALAEQFNCPLVGGDIAIWKRPLAISVTVMGRPDGIEPVLRSGAQIGDAVCVTGPLGAAWQTGRDLTFTPRIAEARQLAGQCDLHAMMDISDGLAMDLPRLCKASGVGAEIRSEQLPVHPDAADLNAALNDGEDYELLFVLPADQIDAIDGPIIRIGTIIEGDAITLIDADGSARPLPAGGWEHKA